MSQVSEQSKNTLKSFVLSMIPDLEEHAWQDFLEPTTETHFKKGEYFCREGESVYDIGFILQGVFKVYYMDDKGEEYIRTIHSEGQPLASYGSLIKDAPSDLTIKALTEAHIARIKYAHLKDMFAKHHKIERFGRLIAEHYLLVREKRERQFLVDDARTRYQNFLATHSTLVGRIPDYEIASFLGITPVTLSRIRNS